MSEQTPPTDDNPGVDNDQPWHAALPDDIKGNPAITRYGSMEAAARGLIHANGMLRTPEDRLIALPEKPDDAEGLAAVWGKIGRPEKPDGYDLKDSKLQGDDSDAFKAFLATMHQAGPMTPAMAKAAEDWYANYGQQVQSKAAEAIQANKTAGDQVLRQEWGAAYDQKFDAAADAALKYGGQELKAFLEETGFGDDPRLIRAWAAVAEAGAEAGPAPKDRGRDGDRPMTPAEAEAEIARMQTDKDISAALNDKNHSQHDYYVQRRLDLFKAKRGGK